MDPQPKPVSRSSTQTLYKHACGFQLTMDLARNRRTAWSVRVDADGARLNVKFGAANSNHSMAHGDVNRLLRGAHRIVNQRTGKGALAQRAIGLIGAVGEGLGSGSQSHG